MTDIVKMDPELKARWVAALRSGDYEQTTGALREQLRNKNCDGFCCLGVLSDLLPNVTWELLDESSMYTAAYTSDNPDVFEDFGELTIPDKHATLLGLNQMISVMDKYDVGVANDVNIASHLMDLNDGDALGRKYTFAEIADWIEENL